MGRSKETLWERQVGIVGAALGLGGDYGDCAGSS